jgi:hypothetical protein
MSEPGQHRGSPEERNRKLIAYYAKLGFNSIDQEKATAYGITTYNAEKPPMENTVGKLLSALEPLSKAGGSKAKVKTRSNRTKYSSQSRRSTRQ